MHVTCNNFDFNIWSSRSSRIYLLCSIWKCRKYTDWGFFTFLYTFPKTTSKNWQNQICQILWKFKKLLINQSSQLSWVSFPLVEGKCKKQFEWHSLEKVKQTIKKVLSSKLLIRKPIAVFIKSVYAFPHHKCFAK